MFIFVRGLYASTCAFATLYYVVAQLLEDSVIDMVFAMW